MTKKRTISVEEANLLDVLDRIMVEQALSSRSQARRWLIEARDHLERQKLTQGHSERVVMEEIKHSGQGNHTTRKKISLHNPIRTLVDESGKTIPEILRPKAEPAIPTPEIHVPNPVSLFDRELAIRAGMRTSKKKGYTKRYEVNSQPRKLLTKPKEGTKARQVYDLLKKNNWESLPTVREAIKLGIFDTSAEHSRGKTAHATVGNVKNRYGPTRITQKQETN